MKKGCEIDQWPNDDGKNWIRFRGDPGEKCWKRLLNSHGLQGKGLLFFLYSVGTLCLVFAFLVQVPVLFAAAVVLLAPVLILFGMGALVAIFRAGKAKTTARAVQLAVIGLMVTFVIGGYLASGYVFEAVSLNRSVTIYHAAWGVIGWILVLSIGVSEQVIPMFLTTPRYPYLFNKRLVYLLMFLLCAGSLLPLQGLEQAPVVLVSVLMLAYAAVTLYLLGKRRRKRLDITSWFWRVGMLCLMYGALKPLQKRDDRRTSFDLPVYSCCRTGAACFLHVLHLERKEWGKLCLTLFYKPRFRS